MMPALDLAAELMRHRHLAVADAEHGNAGIEDGLRRARRARFMHGLRPAGEDHRFRLHLAESRFRLLERHDFRIDAHLAHPARDELGDLAAEIDNQNLFMRRGHLRRRLQTFLKFLGFLCGCHVKQIRDGARARNRLGERPTPFWRPRGMTGTRASFPAVPMDKSDRSIILTYTDKREETMTQAHHDAASLDRLRQAMDRDLEFARSRAHPRALCRRRRDDLGRDPPPRARR